VLKLRVITAVLMLSILLPALVYPTLPPFLCVTLLLISLCAWEWGRLAGFGVMRSVWGGCAVALGGGLIWWSEWLLKLDHDLWFGVWSLVVSVWVLAAGVLLRRGPVFWLSLQAPVRWCVGLGLLCLSWVAVAQARHVGINYLLSIFVLIWVSDISAYFLGQAFGGRFFSKKLAPLISPGKSWEGVLGAVLGVGVLAVFWCWADRVWLVNSGPSVFTMLWQQGWVALVVGVLGLTCLGIAGDLLESLFKRSAGVKDSSHLLPGHGGFLDRMDALLPALPLAMLIYTMPKS